MKLTHQKKCGKIGKHLQVMHLINHTQHVMHTLDFKLHI